jgi:bifunctional non-homologous end joining protein LigD
LRTAVKSG